MVTAGRNERQPPFQRLDPIHAYPMRMGIDPLHHAVCVDKRETPRLADRNIELTSMQYVVIEQLTCVFGSGHTVENQMTWSLF